MLASAFTNWQRQPAARLKAFTRSSPALVAIRTYLLARWGGSNLGIYGVRPVRGGTSMSSHAFGAALDWSWRGLPRAVALEVIDWLIANSAELGVQAIHDYQGSRIWHADRQAWKSQAKNREGMGQSWGDWLHIEVNEQQWNDGRPVEAKLAGQPTPATPAPAPAPVVVPLPTPVLVPAAVEEWRPVLRRGDSGDFVKLVQLGVSRHAGQDVGPIDGKYGSRTEIAVRNVQAFVGAPVTGVVDAAFWHLLDVLGQPKAA
jgi:hypothetical protein